MADHRNLQNTLKTGKGMRYTVDSVPELQSNPPEVFQRKHLSPYQEFNILLLGETGSGKSSWINATMNYLIDDSLENAMEHGIRYVIPTSFYIEDNNNQSHKVIVGSTENEVLVDGMSGTQKPRNYVFNYGNNLINFIDVPGIGDGRGIAKDAENCHEILTCLAKYHDLSAICLVLPPDVTRLGVAFKYCLNELFIRLPTDAISNIFICFTKSRATFFRSNDSLPILKAYLNSQKLDDESKEVHISLNDDTVFYLDNEAFRYLCAKDNGIHTSKSFFDACKDSWKQSRKETMRLLGRVINTPPVRMRGVLSVNETRRVIEILTPILPDYSVNIRKNITLIEQKEKELNAIEGNLNELKKASRVTQIVIKNSKIEMPNTVCTSNKCTTLVQLDGTDELVRYYKQICCQQCEAENRFFLTKLWLCHCMEGTLNRTCSRCGCSVHEHKHIYYNQKEETVSMIDAKVQKLIDEGAGAKQLKGAELKDLQCKKDELSNTQEKLEEICAAFSVFLKKYSLVKYNDAMIDYLDQAIKTAKSGGENSNATHIYVERLEEFKRGYEKQLEILNENGRSSEEVSVAKVDEMMKELFAMKDIGGEIKEAVEMTTRHRDAERVNCNAANIN